MFAVVFRVHKFPLGISKFSWFRNLIFLVIISLKFFKSLVLICLGFDSYSL